MLRVTLVDNEGGQTLMVEGNLIAPYLAELEFAWKEARLAARGKIVVDLTGTTFIDSSGQAALIAMIADGACLTAKGIYNEHLARELTKRTRRSPQSRQGAGLAMDANLTNVSNRGGQRRRGQGQRAS